MNLTANKLRLFLTAVFALLVFPVANAQDKVEDLPKVHFIHTFDGEAEYPADYKHWNYVNPDAPKGGEVILGTRFSFDTFNHMNAKGDPFSPRTMAANLYNSLLTGNSDEIDTSYGELAEWMQMPKDRTWIIFKIRDEAKWADGKPITSEDVIFTWEKQRAEGWPGFKNANVDVTNIEDLGGNRVKFTFNMENGDRELPFKVGAEEIIPKHYWETRDFGETTQEVPLTSGPYRISEFELGQSITFELRDDYWAKDLPFSRGLNNFRIERYDVYREVPVMRKAVKAGKIDFRAENQAKAWATEYENMKDAIDDGVFKKEKLADDTIQGASGAFFNLTLDKFKDRRVREAIALAFDFEWTNKTMFFGQYNRTNSHFQNSFLQATGKPEGKELEILEKYRGQIPDAVFGEALKYPESDGSGLPRSNLRKAQQLFKQAGYTIKDGKMVDAAGKQFSLKYIIYSAETERLINPWIENLRKIGIDANLRLLEYNQWLEEIRERKFEMTGYAYSYTYSPAQTLDAYWTKRFASTKGSAAFHGLINPVLEELIKEVVASTDREQVNTLTRAIDRILTHEHYLVLHWHLPFERIIYWDKFTKPATSPKFSTGSLTTWWIDEEKAKTLAARRENLIRTD